MRTFLDPGIFARVVAVRAQLVEKSPDNVTVLNLFYSGGGGGGGQCLYLRNYNFSKVQAGGGGNVRSSNLFQGDGAQLLFL